MKRILKALRRRLGHGFESDMDEEIRFHLEMRAARERAAGVGEDEAWRKARRHFGHMDGVVEACRDERRFAALHELARDFRSAWRAMMRTPALTAASALALGVGVALLSAELSFVRGVTASVPVQNSERVWEINLFFDGGFSLTLGGMDRKDFAAWKAVQKSFAEVGTLTSPTSADVSGAGRYALGYSARGISVDALRALRLRPVLGRAFSRADEQPGAPLVVMLSHEAWMRDFGGDPALVGRRLRLRRAAERPDAGPLAMEDALVVGIMPVGYTPHGVTDIWFNREIAGPVAVVARLRDGVRPEAAQAELATQGRGFQAPAGLKISHLAGSPLSGHAGKRLIVMVTTLFGVVMGVMALACLNVGTLLLIRAVDRGRELALRMALGASRWRLVRQMLVESATLAALAAAVGLPLALVGITLLDRQLAHDPSKPAWIRLQLDAPALGLILLGSLVVALLAGLAPALRASRVDPSDALKNGGWGAGPRVGRMTRWLVALQSAVACALLLVTGLMVSSMLSVGRFDGNYDPGRVLGAFVSAGNYGRQPGPRRVLERALERARSLPGVEAAALASRMPMQPVPATVFVETRNGTPNRSEIGWQVVTPGYFGLLDAPIRQGRGLLDTDRGGSERVAVVSESLARAAWPAGAPVGARFRVGDDGPWVTVVGVSADLPADSRRGTVAGAVFYTPLAQEDRAEAVLLLRASVDPHAVIRPLRDALRELDPDLPAKDYLTVQEVTAQRAATPRALAAMALAFALSAVALAAVGIYGVTGFAVRKRMREFGIRVALGASPADMNRLTLGRGLVQVGLSLLAGAVLGWGVSRPVLASLEDFSGAPPAAAYPVIAAVVVVSTFAAIWFPSRRAARVDPVETLRLD